MNEICGMSAAEAVEYLLRCEIPNLIFDLDDTLYYRKEPYLKAYRRLFGERIGKTGYPDEETLYAVSRPIGEEEYLRRIRGEIDLREMLRLRTQRSFSACGVAISDEEAFAFEREYEKAQHEITLRTEYRKFFEEDRKRHPGRFLGIMTNGPGERQRGKISALGLNQWIPEDHVYISGEQGVGKPSLEAFRRCEHLLGIRAEETMIIGDSLEADIKGAQNAGWRGLLVF